MIMHNIVRRLHQNDHQAFTELYECYHRKVFNFVMRYVKDETVSVELTQQLFIKLWEKRKMLSMSKPIDSQVFAITRNLIIDTLRKKARKNLFERDWRHNHPLYEHTTEQDVLHSEASQRLEEAVNALPPRRKKVFQLSRNQGLTYKEIAEELVVSPKTVEIQMSKALKVLRSKMASFLHPF